MCDSTLLRAGTGLLWTVAVAGTVAILASSVFYLVPGFTHPFLAERPELSASHLWRGSLLLHVAGGMLVLPAGLFLLSRRALVRWRSLHVSVGRVYVALLVGLMLPTGMHLAWHAKGGLAAGSGFALSNLVAACGALYAVHLAMRSDRAGHRAWMLRSFAQVASAISFRIFHLALQLLQTPYVATYVTSLWLSVLGNALLAELILYTVRRRDGHSESGLPPRRHRETERNYHALPSLASARVSAPDVALHARGRS